MPEHGSDGDGLPNDQTTRDSTIISQLHSHDRFSSRVLRFWDTLFFRRILINNSNDPSSKKLSILLDSLSQSMILIRSVRDELPSLLCRLSGEPNSCGLIRIFLQKQPICRCKDHACHSRLFWLHRRSIRSSCMIFIFILSS